MTILRMQREKTDGPVSGSGMDRVVEKRGLSTRVKIALGGAAVLLAALGFWWFAPSGASQTVGADRVVKVVGRTLADHRWIFDDAARRAQLVEILELFVDRGWPQARRLLYELPDLFR